MSAVNLSVRGTCAVLGLLLWSTSPSLAQTKFQRTYGGTSDDYGYSVQQTSDRGYIITGYTNSFGAGSYDVYLIKTNPRGETLWTRTYGGPAGDFGYCGKQTSDGGYIVTGGTLSFSAGNSQVYLIKTDSLGGPSWTRTYGGASGSVGRSVQQSSDGGYIITGYTTSIGANNRNVYLIKTNSSGDTLWTRTFGGSGDDEGYSVQQTSDTGYIITGYTNSFGAGSYDVYLIKTNSRGDNLWTSTFGGSGDDEGYSVQQTSDRGYIIAGYTTSFGAGGADVYLIKTDSLGIPFWTQTYGGTGNDQGYSVQQTTDTGYIVTGFTISLVTGGYEVYLIKTDSSGDTLWTRTFGGSRYGEGYSVQQTSDGGFIVTGNTFSFGAGSADVYLIKTDRDGVDAVGTVQNWRGIPRGLVLKQNYPNPFNPSTTINYELPTESCVSLRVYNLLGQEVATLIDAKQEAGYKTAKWSAASLSSGVYFFRLQAGGFSDIKKLVLTK